MADKMTEIYGAYDLQINQVMRGRGAFILRTDKGVFQLKPMDGNPSRLDAEYELKEGLLRQGFSNIDYCIRNKDEELYTCDRYGNPYVLRKYFLGKECNPLSMQDMTSGVRNLARLHQSGQEVFRQSEKDVHIRVTGDFKKRNQALKRVNNYIMRQKSKREFELKFLKTYEYFAKQGECCQKDYDKLGCRDRGGCHLGYCHGMYNHHSLVMTGDEVGTVGFDKFYLGNQMDDLYHFVRKMVEKNDYSIRVMSTILDEYGKVNPLSREDYEYIYINYCYPEKLYKLANQYMNGTKNWLSPKLLEKMDKFIEDEGKKQLILDRMRKMYL